MKSYMKLSVLRERIGVNGEREFHIKWKGYRNKTWEPFQNLNDIAKKSVS